MPQRRPLYPNIAQASQSLEPLILGSAVDSHGRSGACLPGPEMLVQRSITLKRAQYLQVPPAEHLPLQSLHRGVLTRKVFLDRVFQESNHPASFRFADGI